jgi:hypothetical protein
LRRGVGSNSYVFVRILSGHMYPQKFRTFLTGVQSEDSRFSLFDAQSLNRLVSFSVNSVFRSVRYENALLDSSSVRDLIRRQINITIVSTKCPQYFRIPRPIFFLANNPILRMSSCVGDVCL